MGFTERNVKTLLIDNKRRILMPLGLRKGLEKTIAFAFGKQNRIYS